MSYFRDPHPKTMIDIALEIKDYKWVEQLLKLENSSSTESVKGGGRLTLTEASDLLKVGKPIKAELRGHVATIISKTWLVRLVDLPYIKFYKVDL